MGWAFLEILGCRFLRMEWVGLLGDIYMSMWHMSCSRAIAREEWNWPSSSELIIGGSSLLVHVSRMLALA